MDCLEFRRLLGSDPRVADPAARAHLETCPRCQDAFARAQAFEAHIAGALAVAVPEGLADRLLLAQLTAERQRRRGFRYGWIALAAAAALVVAVGLARREGTFASSLPDLVVAQQVGTAVADVAHRQPVTVEQRDRGRRTRAGEAGLVVDQVPDPLRGPVDRTGHLLEPGVLVVVRARRLVDAADLADGRARGEVAPGRTADAVADRQQPRPGVPGVLVVLADPPDVGDRGVLQSERHLRSSRRVLPMRTWVPSVSVVGWVMRALPM